MSKSDEDNYSHAMKLSTRDCNTAEETIVYPHENMKGSRYIEELVVAIFVLGFLFAGLICLISYYLAMAYILSTISQVCLYAVISGTGLAAGQDYMADSANLIVKPFFLVIALTFTSYTIYWNLSGPIEDKGSLPCKFMRNLSFWVYMANYFPVSIIPSDELKAYSRRNDANACLRESNDLSGSREAVYLPLDKNYLAGCHPHGIFSTGAFLNFATDATGFKQYFPGLNRYVVTLKVHFMAAIYRDILISLGIISAKWRSMQYLLDSEMCKRTGNLVVTILGGAREALDSRPGQYLLHINNRTGFFRLALETGSSLVPCISFGESNLFNQASNGPFSLLRKFQEKLIEKCSFTLPIFYGKFIIPYRTPITTVVGVPIDVAKVSEPSEKEISHLKEKYKVALTEIFSKYKHKYDPKANDIQFI